MPPLQRLPRGETRLAFARSDTHWGIDELDVVTQSFTSHHMTLRTDAGSKSRFRSAMSGPPSWTSWRGWPG